MNHVGASRTPPECTLFAVHPDVHAEVRHIFVLGLAFILRVLYMQLHRFEKYVRGKLPPSRAYRLQVSVQQVFTDSLLVSDCVADIGELSLLLVVARWWHSRNQSVGDTP